MSNRISSFLVVMQSDLTEEQAKATLDAIAQIRGVIAVKPEVSDINTAISTERARYELQAKLWAVLK